MDSNNNNNNNGDAPSGADVLLSPGRQDSVSDTVLDSEISDDADLEVMRKRINEMEEEAEKTEANAVRSGKTNATTGHNRKLYVTHRWFDVSLISSSFVAQFPTIEEKMEADQKSVYVGSVSDQQRRDKHLSLDPFRFFRLITPPQHKN